MTRIRLYRGPFNGKVMEHPEAGSNEIMIMGHKSLTRKQKYEQKYNQWLSAQGSNLHWGEVHPSIVRARYRLVRRVQVGWKTALNPVSVEAVCTHPDGSIFYEWVNPKK